MGLFDFLKKKPSDQPIVQSFGNPDLNTDLPSIDGSTVLSNNNPSDVNFTGSQFPGLNQPVSDANPKSVSINVPSLDFSLPDADETATTTIPAPASVPDKGYVSVDDLNKLFISDDWKEPDWNNFDPNNEEAIEEPKPEDFALAAESDLPSFTEEHSPMPSVQQSEPRRTGPKPVDLYIRGRAYNRVFDELAIINQTLSRQDSKMPPYEELLKHEELLIGQAREQTEYLYKKLNQVDRKIFS